MLHVYVILFLKWKECLVTDCGMRNLRAITNFTD